MFTGFSKFFDLLLTNCFKAGIFYSVHQLYYNTPGDGDFKGWDLGKLQYSIALIIAFFLYLMQFARFIVVLKGHERVE